MKKCKHLKQDATSDIAAIDQVLRGDTSAFRILVLRYQDFVFSIARKRGATQNEVDDIAQDVFLRAFKNLKSYDQTRATFSTWLGVIACNIVKNKKRKSWNELRAYENLQMAQEPRHSLSPFYSQAFQKLPTLFRRTLSFFFQEELSLSEIAEREGIAVGTVKSRLARGKQMWRDVVRQEDNND